MFDSSAFIAPFVIRIKYFQQQLCGQGIAWDEIFSVELKKNWKKWLSEIEEIKILKIPRYYFDAKNLEKDNIQLQIFTNANQKAHGSVSIRYRTGGDNFKTAFILVESRGALLKKPSLPRLELMGALVGLRQPNT